MIIEAVFLLWSGICIKRAIEILYFANCLVICDKTPGLSLTSNLKYKELEFRFWSYDKNQNFNSLYLRFEVKDKPGVLSQITKQLAKYKISIARLIQNPDHKRKTASIVIITHKAKELNSNRCLKSFKSNKNVIKSPTLIRLL